MNFFRNTFETAKHYYQRAKRGYSDRDLWNFDAYLMDVITNGLTDFRNSKLHGHPVDVESIEDWQKEIDTIVEKLQSGVELMHGNYSYKNKAERLQEEFSEGMDLLKNRFFNLWD